MALSSENINSIRNTASNQQDPLQDIAENITANIKDPFGAIITKVATKIGSLSITVEQKIDSLSKKIVESAESTGKVTVQGSNIVITITKENLAQAEQIKGEIEVKIQSVQKVLTTLKTTLQSLQAIQTAISTLQTALSIQEIALSANPATGPIFLVLKQGIKVLFLKEMVKEYSNILKRQLAISLKDFERISGKFKNIQVSLVIQDEKNKGNSISTTEAENIIVQSLLDGVGPDKDLSNVVEEFISPKNVQYLLKVEKYEERQLIARAYEKESGMIKQQTSPSFFSTPEELLSELKTILNINS